MNTEEYFIGLKKDVKFREWRWISDNSKLNDTRGEFPWAKNESSGDGKCAVRYKDYRQSYGLFNDLRCAARIYGGYICGSPTTSTDQEGMSYKLLRCLLRLHWAICSCCCCLLVFQIAPDKLFLNVKLFLTHWNGHWIENAWKQRRFSLIKVKAYSSSLVLLDYNNYSW